MATLDVCLPSGVSELDDSADAGLSGLVCAEGTITACGNPGEPCCGEQGCSDGGCCVGGACVGDGDACPGGLGTCGGAGGRPGACNACGANGSLCCSDGGPDLGFCTAPGVGCRIFGFSGGRLNSDCLTCGAPGQNCCPNQECKGGGCCINDICSSAGEACSAIGDGGLCQAGTCGNLGGLNLGLLGITNGCTAAFTTPDRDAGLCVACGGQDEPCCTETVDGYSFVTCATGYSCEGATCGDAGCALGTCH